MNKVIWSGLGWNPDARVVDILREYSRYFIGDDYADDFAQGLLALERNWQGPLLTKAAQSDRMRASLIAVARTMFAERGYGPTPTEDIVAAAGVTRGALYHHFRDKLDLFEAVYTGDNP